MNPLFSGEMQLLSWSDSAAQGPKIVLALAASSDLEPFKAIVEKKGNRAGQRLAVVIVEIGDNEELLPPPATKPLSVRAALLCKTIGFQNYVERVQGYGYSDPIDREKQAANYLRAQCQVASRAELDKNGNAGARFGALLATIELGDG